MKRTKNHWNVLCALLLLLSACSITKEGPKHISFCQFPDGASIEEKVKMAANVIPSKRQLDWQKLEFTAFICYGINTFTGAEWGTGKEDLKQFNPTALDANQWVNTAKDAGMKLVLLTCKHHDGFCLWPSKYTDFTVAVTPWKDGKGDLVRDVSEACEKEDLKFGVYLSPWDMNHPDYGTEKYNDFFINQLTELLTEYGTIDEVWFDGANGVGPNGKKQVYDWDRYYTLIRKLQPNAVIAIMGPDVRWVGNESGYGRDTEWSVMPASATSLSSIAESSQQEAGTGTFLPNFNWQKDDLGSREVLKDAKGAIWFPSEVDVSIRPGWYYSASQDAHVKSPKHLIDIYYNSIGKNSLLLLNLPPDQRGLIHENDVNSLTEMTRILKETFKDDLATQGKMRTKDSITQLEFDEPITFDRLMVQEDVMKGQRVERFVLEYWKNSEWIEAANATTIGYKRILRFDPVTTDKVRLVIKETRATPHILNIGLYKSSKDEK